LAALLFGLIPPTRNSESAPAGDNHVSYSLTLLLLLLKAVISWCCI